MALVSRGFKDQESYRMAEWLWPVLLLAAYFVLMRWVLPRLGVQT